MLEWSDSQTARSDLEMLTCSLVEHRMDSEQWICDDVQQHYHDNLRAHHRKASVVPETLLGCMARVPAAPISSVSRKRISTLSRQGEGRGGGGGGGGMGGLGEVVAL